MFSKVKTEQRELARTIRRVEGVSIKEIARRLGVAPSSVSVWVRDIKLTPSQHQELLRRNPAYNRQLSGTAIQAANRRRERIAYQEAGRRLAQG
jgi:transposase-like protein